MREESTKKAERRKKINEREFYKLRDKERSKESAYEINST